MRLTADVINAAPSYLNPLKERELDLRGRRIPQIENLGVAGPQDAIDFTDNDIHILGNFPLAPRLRTLLFARNRISVIQPNLADSLPNLTNLVLTANQLTELSDLDPLGRFGRLTHLVLLDNPVTKRDHYRHWVIWRCPTVRFFDFQKVKDVERRKAEELFGTHDLPTDVAKKIMSTKSNKFDVVTSAREADSGSAASATSKLAHIKLTDTERTRLQERIRKATNLEEIARLEKELAEGRIPAGVYEGDAMEE